MKTQQVVYFCNDSLIIKVFSMNLNPVQTAFCTLAFDCE